MITESAALTAAILAEFAKRPCASMAIDAATIERCHFLDIMLLAPYSSPQPFLYDAIEKANLTAEDYGNVVAAAINQLKNEEIKVRSIVGDNFPA
jgi:hypothetical protein